MAPVVGEQNCRQQHLQLLLEASAEAGGHCLAHPSRSFPAKEVLEQGRLRRLPRKSHLAREPVKNA